MLAAREALLDAVVDLQTAMPASGPLPPGAPSYVGLCPAFALDLAGTARTYRNDCALIVDVGGNDFYVNNAGGAPVGRTLSHSAGPFTVEVPVVSTVAALIDVRGDDRYGDPLNPSKKLGVNGGASGLFLVQPAGFLFDGAGNDRYVGGSYGSTGGGSAGGYGHLVDVSGADSYTGGSGAGSTGGGHLFGVGLLVDGDGRDSFRGNNGAGGVGIGTLVSVGGSDTYTGGNGGGLLGVGLLLDRLGNDAYRSGSGAANGAGSAGLGLLLDQGGTDTYSDQALDVVTGMRCSGKGTDRTVAPKCAVGAQLDLP